MNLINAFAIILSVVSLIITIVGFFASLKFYRDGVSLQTVANSALVKIEEKTQAIQTQVGGMFDKTLDAAIGRRNELTANFEELDAQVEQTKESLVQEALQQIGAAGENERRKLEDLVRRHISLIQEKVETTRESAEEIASGSISNAYPRSDLQAGILTVLSASTAGLSLSEIAEHVRRNVEDTTRALFKLRQRGLVKFTVSEHGPLYVIAEPGRR